jgi:hypothetical protein
VEVGVRGLICQPTARPSNAARKQSTIGAPIIQRPINSAKKRFFNGVLGGAPLSFCSERFAGRLDVNHDEADSYGYSNDCQRDRSFLHGTHRDRAVDPREADQSPRPTDDLAATKPITVLLIGY